MTPWLESFGPGWYMGFRILIGIPLLIFAALALFLPFILNRKFDPFFATDIKKLRAEWKSPGFPHYFFYKARDYAHAVIRKKFAQKQFSVSRSFFRERCGYPTVGLCYLFVAVEFFSYAVVFPFAALLMLFD